MNARAYFCILRPVQTLVIASFYTWIFGLYLWKIFACAPLPESTFLSLVLVGPFFFGTALLGPLHEVMHCSFFPLVPGARLALRRWHFGAVAIVTVILFTAAQLPSFQMPRVATLGLILFGLTLPLLNNRKPGVSALILKSCVFLAVCAFLALPSRSLLIDVGNRVPWFVIVVGVACAVFCFRYGFDASRVRERSRRPQFVCCLQSTLPIPGTGFSDILRHARTENARNAVEKRAAKLGRDWTAKVVGSSLLGWVRVIHHTRFGADSHARTVITFILAGFLPVIPVGLVPYIFARLNPGKGVGFVAFCGQLADSGRIGLDRGRPAEFFFVMAPLFGTLLVTVAGAIAVGPGFSFPISRQRRADAVFIETIRLGALACLGYAAAMFTSVIVAVLIAGHPLDIGLFARSLVGVLIVPPLALINLAILHFIARIRWLMSPGGSMVIILVVLIAAGSVGALVEELGPAVFLHRVSFSCVLITPLGLLAWFALTGLSLWLFRLAVIRHFKKCDLTNPIPWAKAFYPGT